MRTDTVQTILRDDYQPYPYQFHTVALNFDLDATKTRVHSVYNIESTSDTPQALLLDGDELELESVLIDGQTVDQSKWKLDNRSEEHTSELQSRGHLVCRLLLE